MEKAKFVKVGLVGGNNYRITIPKEFVQALNIDKGDYVKVYINDGKIIVEKVE